MTNGFLSSSQKDFFLWTSPVLQTIRPRNQNRSIVGKNDLREFLANKGGGDGTGIGGSSADGKDTSGMFIFSKNIIHGEDVSEKSQCRRVGVDGQLLPTHFSTNEKGGVTGDLGVRWVRGCLEPCVPDLSPENTVVLIMDGHGSHFTLELLTYCRQVGIVIVLRPQHTTHILQGEDLVHFAVFKPAYHNTKMTALGKKIFKKGAYRLTAADLLKVAKKAWEDAFSPDNCLKAWRVIGVSPFTQNVYWEL